MNITRPGQAAAAIDTPALVVDLAAMAEGGIADIYFSNEVIEVDKLARVAALAQRCTLVIAVDSALGIERLAAACSLSAAPTLQPLSLLDVNSHLSCTALPVMSLVLSRAKSAESSRPSAMACAGEMFSDVLPSARATQSST